MAWKGSGERRAEEGRKWSSRATRPGAEGGRALQTPNAEDGETTA
jgi:hypothetical protein